MKAYLVYLLITLSPPNDQPAAFEYRMEGMSGPLSWDACWSLARHNNEGIHGDKGEVATMCTPAFADIPGIKYELPRSNQK